MPLHRQHPILALMLAAAALLALPALASAAGDLTPSPASLGFGTQDIHSGPGGTQTTTFTNETGGDLNVSSVTITGSDASDFYLVGNDCGDVPDTGTCNVGVQFDPSIVGPESAQVELTDDNGTVFVPLGGTGATGTLTGSSPSFYPQPYYYGSQGQNANVNNGSSFGVLPGSVTITGPDASFFSINYNGCNFFMNPGNGCGVGVNFDPGNSPGTRNAQLELSNDGTVDPLIIPLSATALAGPVIALDPAGHDFGDVAVGSSSTARDFTVTNAGDAPLQVQQLLVISGRPQLFPISVNSCSGAVINPTESCQFTMRFQPSAAGLREASIFLITNNPGPVTTIPVSGSGVIAPNGSVTVDGTPEAGTKLTCAPHGYPAGLAYSYRWLRGGKVLAGATGGHLTLTDADVGHAFACRVTATNSVGSETVTSPKTAPLAPRDLSNLPGSLVDRLACREVRAPARIGVAGAPARIGFGHPVTPWTTMNLTAAGGLRASIDGTFVGRGRAIAITPRVLNDFIDGAHTLGVATPSGSSKAKIALATCRLAVRLQGGGASSSSLTISAVAGIGSARVRLPGGLRLRHPRDVTGRALVKSAGHPAQTFALSGKRSSSNGMGIRLGAHIVRVLGLPTETGVVRLTLSPGSITGGGAGLVRSRARLRGTLGTVSSRSAPVWRR